MKFSKWHIAPAEEADIRRLGEAGYPQLVSQVLAARGISTADEAAAFLERGRDLTCSPFLMKDMDRAVECISRAIGQGLRMAVFGDYDVDGSTATVILVDYLLSRGGDVVHYIPRRIEDGYGLSRDAIENLYRQGARLLITVDCGISTPEEVRCAKELGFTVIITDHHEPPADTAAFPRADAVVNPRQAGCTFAQGALAGVSVAFFLLVAVRRALVDKGYWTQEKMPNLRDALDLVALGTIADVMPLTGVNRILVRAGLEVISRRSRPGIAALCTRAGLREERVSAEQIAYQLGPRINAAGRLGRPQLAAELLLVHDPSAAAVLADELEAANLLRRELEAEVLTVALQQAEQQRAAGQRSLVLHGPDWHPGVIGIIASRMIDRFHLPTLVFTGDSGHEELLKGSGRSVPGLNLHQVLEQCTAWLVHFGGHAMAAGATLRQENLAQFRTAFAEAVHALHTGPPPVGLLVDAVLDEGTDYHELARTLQLLEPFGHGNPEPVFLLRQIRLREVNTLREHLRFTMPLNGSLVKGIGFFMADQFTVASAGAVDLAFRLKESSFRGQSRVEVHAVAIDKAGLEL